MSGARAALPTDDTLSRLIQTEGTRKGVYSGRYRNPEKAAAAHARIQYLSALRARVRADAALLAAGIDPKDFENELARAVQR